MLDTTTLSTIVLQRQSTRIVVAFLKSGSKINLKVLEMQPDLGYLGRDFEEAATLQKSFVEVLQQLQSKQSPVEDLLRQADQLIVNQKPKACVYSAMAESLGVAWQDLHRLIEQRRTIIDKNFLFQGHLQDFECKVADLEGMIAKAQNSWKIPATKELTRQRKIILEASVFALQEGDSLLGILNDAWLKTVPGITPQSLRQSLARAVETVEIWMETIYDRRTSVMSSLKTFLDNQIWPLDLGSSLLEVEELLLKNKNSEQIELLKKARKFFESSKEAFGKLDLLESHYDQKTYEEADKLVEIAKNFGQTLISSSNNVETKGVQNCLTSLTEKSEAIKRICDSKRRNSTSLKNFKGQIDEIDNWLKSFSATVDDVGQTIQEVNRFLSNCKNNLCALQRKSHEIEGMLGALKIMSEDGEVSPDYEKVIRQLLQEGQRQEERIEIANSLMKFLKVTKDIEEEMNGGNDLERKRQNLQQLYLQACNLSKNCIALLDEKVHARIDAEKIKDNIGQIMDGINNRQNELIAAWNRVKSKESQKQKTERLLEDLRVSWESGFNPFISLSSLEPAFVVSSLEKSYGHIAKTRDILKRLIDLNSDDMISRDPITRGQAAIGEIEVIFQALITFTKHLASLNTSVKEEINKYQDNVQPTNLAETERLAKEHEKSKSVVLRKLETLKEEAKNVSGQIKKFEQNQPQVRVMGGDLTLQMLIEEIQNSFIKSWEQRKYALTQQAKRCWLSQQLKKVHEDLDASLQSLGKMTLIVDERHLMESKTIVQNTEQKSLLQIQRQIDSLKELNQDELAKITRKMSSLRSQIESLKDKLALTGLFFELEQKLERPGNETMSADFEKWMEISDKLNGFVSTTKISYFKEKLAEMEKPPPRPPPPAPICPYFEIELTDIVLGEGDRCQMKAKLQGDPSPKVTWFKDGVSVENNPDYLRSSLDDQGWVSLTIAETILADSANWSVRASNMGGYAESHAKLTVQELIFSPPSIIEPLKQISAKEGEDINLICRFEGLPEPHLTWYKDEKQLGNPGPILTLRNVSKVDAGLYTCQAKNPHGVANSSASLTISTPWQLPKFIEPLSNMEVTLGTPLVLKCRLDSGHPPPEISWQHNERGLHQHSHYDTATQSLTLFIEKMDRQSEGKYTCCAKNSAGMATSTATITAKEPKLTPPAFYVPLKNQECNEGDRVILEAVIISTPPPDDIRWFKNEQLLSQSDRVQIHRDGDVYQLILVGVQKVQDEGSYKIKATNPAGTAQSACSVSVIPSPKATKKASITKKLVGVSADQGDRVELAAFIEGAPQPQIKWLKNGRPLKSGEALIKDENGLHTLVLENVEESATYQIVATNDVGSEASSADVEVRPPRPPWPPTMRPSKFRKGEMYHSDYESDWDASPIPPKWRPCHSDTEDLVGASKYRSVKPKLKQGRQRSNEKRPPSPPCPHQWESHEDIENLEKSLREGRNLVRPPTKDPLKLPRRCHSTPVGITTSTVTKTSSEHVIVKKEFVSVKRRAQLLEDMLSAQPQSGDESSERATPIKPEALAGAVRVLPPTTSSPLSFGRSASVDMTANGISPMMMAFGPYSTLPAKPFRSESCHVNRDERQSNLATTTLSRKFQVAITSSEDKSISKSEADSPPTIQLTAFKNDQLFKPSKFVPFGDTEGMIWKPTTPLHRA